MAKKLGRPTKYKPEYCDEIIAFFDVPRSEQRVKSVTTGKNDYEKTDYETVPNPLPTLAKFARSIKVSRDTVNQWVKDHPEFSDAHNVAKDIQKDFLVDNGLEGLYPPASFIFTAKNITDMRDKTELDHTSKGERIAGFNYVPPHDPNPSANTQATPSVSVITE